MKKIFTEKHVTCIFIILFIVMLTPICYLSFINRATGDDYGYAIHTREAWQASHSLVMVIRAACTTVREYYHGWQGTWFSVFLFTFQPEVFNDKAYVITAFLMLFCWIGSTFIMFREIMVTEMNFDHWTFRLFTIIFLIISIQFIPSTKSSIFWYNGAAHYMIPYAMCQFLVCVLLRFGREYHYKWFAVICFLMTLLGGVNYQAALFGLIVTFYIGTQNYLDKKDKKVFLLIVSGMCELVGLIISMIAPGNRARGGDEFGFSLSKAVVTIGCSFTEAVRDIWIYIKEEPLVFVGLIALFMVVFYEYRKTKQQIIKHPVIAGLGLFCLYSAMHAPAIYAGVPVSGGVYNMNYQVFLLMASGELLIIAQQLLLKYPIYTQRFYNKIIYGGMFLCFCLLIMGRSNVKTSTLWICMEYIVSGQAMDYKEQMDLQTSLLSDKDTKNVVIPGINDVQGPLMHMPVTGDPDAWTNTVTKNFYGKRSVIAIPRTEWEAINKQQN